MAKKPTTQEDKTPGKPHGKAAKQKPARKSPASAAASKPSDRLTLLVERNYAELRSIAEREIVTRKLSRTITPSSLVAETVMRLMRQRELPKTAPQLCGLATILMVRALSDRARRSRAKKRSGPAKAIPLDEEIDGDRRTGAGSRDEGMPLLHARLLAGLERLSKRYPREMEIITLRLVLGMPMAKVAVLAGVPERTAYRELNEGLEFLKQEMGWAED